MRGCSVDDGRALLRGVVAEGVVVVVAEAVVLHVTVGEGVADAEAGILRKERKAYPPCV